MQFDPAPLVKVIDNDSGPHNWQALVEIQILTGAEEYVGARQQEPLSWPRLLCSNAVANDVLYIETKRQCSDSAMISGNSSLADSPLVPLKALREYVVMRGIQRVGPALGNSKRHQKDLKKYDFVF